LLREKNPVKRKTKKPVLRTLAAVTSALVCCALNLHAQPTITTQPASQTNLAGTDVSFSVTAVGVGPFTYQWQFNHTNLPNNIVTTVAGNGGEYPWFGSVATNVGLAYPAGMALDAVGNLYFAVGLQNRIRKVDTNGIIITVAGNGSPGYSGDGGAASNATFDNPNYVAIDTVGNLYIADTGNARIRKMDTNGIITTVAGKGGYGFSGDGGAAINASFSLPFAVAVDAPGNLYIADADNNRIRKVDTNGIITTVAGGGSGGNSGAATNANLNYPCGMCLDVFGNLYIADTDNSRIRKVDTNGMITTVAGDGNKSYTGNSGAATNASLNDPCGMCLDVFGNLYIADSDNNRIRKVDTNGIISTMAGNGHPTYAGDGGAATNASFWIPEGVALDASGNLYIADTINDRIRKVFLGSGFPAFALSKVAASDAGDYTVVITSPYGSVTSAVATLTVTIPSTPPQIISSDASFGFLTNQFGFNIGGAFDQTIVVDGSTDLVNWIPLFTNTSAGSPFYFSDPASTNFPWRFYRARLP
jgi:sugar lactone lactonase YvrE